MFEEKLQQAFANLQIPCTSDQAAQCARYFAMLVEANQTMNLTNVTQEDEAILLHLSLIHIAATRSISKSLRRAAAGCLA